MTDKNPDALLPCPFCGGKAELEKFPSSLKDRCWQIDCVENERCKCSVSTCALSSKEEAIAAWNTRATPHAEAVRVMHNPIKHAAIYLQHQRDLNVVGIEANLIINLLEQSLKHPAVVAAMSSAEGK